MACARCHDHKFDPISTADYYALTGFLQSSRRQDAMLDPKSLRLLNVRRNVCLSCGDAVRKLMHGCDFSRAIRRMRRSPTTSWPHLEVKRDKRQAPLTSSLNHKPVGQVSYWSN